MTDKELNIKLAYLKWLIPKCKYAVENGSDEYIKERFVQLILTCQEIVNANGEIKKNEQMKG